MVTHVDADILKCKVKLALGSIVMNKDSGDDEIASKLFKILKDDAVKALYSICQQIWRTQQRQQDWKRSVCISIPKNFNAKECSNYHTIVLISNANKVMFKVLQARLQQYMNQELPHVPAGFQRGRGNRDQITDICCIIEKAREFQENISLCYIDYMKVFDCVDYNKSWAILKEMAVPKPPYLSLRNLYVGQEAIRTGHGTMDWFKIGSTRLYILTLLI